MAGALSPELTSVLKDTSRSFYKTLKFLPSSIRPQISLAYLLARTTDTIADTEIVSVELRQSALQKLRERILAKNNVPLNFGELALKQGAPAERLLLERAEDSLVVLQSLSTADQRLVHQVLDTITSGQELDLRRFAGATADNIVALQNDSELDDYTYRVAGCVGKFWTDMCVAHEFSAMEVLGMSELTEPFFSDLGIRFGKGLQLINILRDLPVDLRKGRCYVPADALAAAGLKPSDLLEPGMENKFRPLYNRYLDLAESHLIAGWEYTLIIPWPHIRLRVACALPILIGVETLKRLRVENVLDPARRIKISRDDVKRILWRVLLRYPWQPGWKRLGPVAAFTPGKPVAQAPKMS